MSLDKAIIAGKEHRTPYRRSKRFDPSCRNHGSCPRCMTNRMLASLAVAEAILERMAMTIELGRYIKTQRRIAREQADDTPGLGRDASDGGAVVARTRPAVYRKRLAGLRAR